MALSRRERRPPRRPDASKDADDVAGTYVVRCADGSLYVGYARAVVARVALHSAGRGARYTRARRPVRLCWFWETTTERARRLEGLLKKLDRRRRLRLVDGDPTVLLPALAEVARRVRR
ncbi:MAG: GIY-YIG nuclease family protein [Deltaproteobacteria bacterium]|nr:GIY-YIG nuclease family protein [Deltaproteobacteria bacterium]